MIVKNYFSKCSIAEFSLNERVDYGVEADIILKWSRSEHLKQYFDSDKSVRLGINFSYLRDEDICIFRKRYLGIDFLVGLEGISNLGKRPLGLYISNSFKKHKIPLRDLPRASDFRESLATLVLIDKGYSLAHMALVRSPWGGIAIAAYPNVGKTTTATILSTQPDFIALSDDISLIDGTGNSYGPSFRGLNIYAYAELRFLREARNRFLINLRRAIGEVFRYLGYLPGIPNLGDKLLLVKLPNDAKTESGWTKVKHLFILEEHHEEGFLELDPDIAFKKLYAIVKNEHSRFYFDNNPLLISCSYFKDDFDFEQFIEKRKEIIKIKKFVENTRAFLVRASKPTNFSKLMLNILKS